MIAIADAGGRLMYAYKDLLELAGLTARVYTLISTLHALPPVREFIADDDKIALNGVSICVPERTVRGDKHDVLDDCDDHSQAISPTCAFHLASKFHQNHSNHLIPAISFTVIFQIHRRLYLLMLPVPAACCYSVWTCLGQNNPMIEWRLVEAHHTGSALPGLQVHTSYSICDWLGHQPCSRLLVGMQGLLFRALGFILI